MFFQTPAWDLALFTHLNQGLRSPVLDFVLPLFSSSALLWVVGAAACAWMLKRCGLRRAAICLLVFLAVAAADASSSWIKGQTGRIRPLNALPGTVYREKNPGEWRQRPPDFTPDTRPGNSFPSAHAANTMALAVMAALLWPRTRAWIFTLPLLTGWSRVYLGKHYPSDVLAGWLLGLTVAGMVYVLWLLAQDASKKTRTP